MKVCKNCEITKPVREFYKTASGSPMHICKQCHKERMKINRLTNPSVQAYDRERAKTPERKAQAARVSTEWRQNHPDAYRAQNAVNNAVRDGKLFKQPCAICSTDKNVHAHHEDYSRPLDVKWLCAKCHHRIHSVFPQLGGHYQAAQ